MHKGFFKSSDKKVKIRKVNIINLSLRAGKWKSTKSNSTIAETEWTSKADSFERQYLILNKKKLRELCNIWHEIILVLEAISNVI